MEETSGPGIWRTAPYRSLDDLVRLQKDATFTVWTLGKPYTYKVREIKEVFAAEAWNQPSPAGMDLFTMVSAEPPQNGTVSQESGKVIMVTGERAADDGQTQDESIASMVNERSFTVGIAVFAMLTVSIVGIVLIRRKLRSPRYADISGKLELG